MSRTIDRINNTSSTIELSDIIEEYLLNIGEHDATDSESYQETAERLGGDDVLEAAQTRWFELDG